jgi:hypothetical protein
VIIPLALFVLITIATFYPDPHENEAVQAYVYAQGGDVAALNLESCKDTGRTDGMMDYPLYRCVFTSDELSPSEVDAIVTHQLNGGCFAVYGDPGEDRGLEAEITGGCDKKR